MPPEFVVSARKYRPVRFDEVVGQEHVSETLKNALRQNRLAHAFLFCGPRGVGKTTNARILAKVLNCLNVGEDYEPCNECANCVAFNQNASFNIFELDGASNNKVDHMHQLMEQVRVPPQSGRKKVYIIDEVHMLSQSAFNAFLKTLEEPPDYAVFILATTEKHKILPTILSRCQVYDFHRIKPSAMVAHLEGICAREGVAAEPEALHLIAEKADGALRDALSIFDRVVSSASAKTPDGRLDLSYAHAAEQLNVLDHATFFEVTDALMREDVHGLYLLLDGVLAAGFEPEPFLGGLARHLRQLFVCKSPQTLKLIDVSDALRARYAEQAAKAPLAFLVNALNLAAECEFRLRQSANKRLHVELYLVKMAYALRTVGREAIATPGGVPSAAAAAPAPAMPVLAEAPEKKSDGPSAVAPQPQPRTPPPTAPAPPPSAVAEPVTPPAERPTQPAAAAKPAPAAKPAAAAKPAPAALPSIAFDEDDDEGEPADAVDPADLTLERLRAAWEASGADQPQRIRSVMRRAALSYDPPQLTVRVGSALAQNTLRTEAVSIRDIKAELNCPALVITVELDAALAPKEPEKKKALGPREKYQALLDVNPEVDNLRRRFGLELDE